jgi:hypothetical protein
VQAFGGVGEILALLALPLRVALLLLELARHLIRFVRERPFSRP